MPQPDRRQFCAGLAGASFLATAAASKGRFLPNGYRRSGSKLLVQAHRVAGMLAIPVRFGETDVELIEVSSVGSGLSLRAGFANRFGLMPGKVASGALPAARVADLPLVMDKVVVRDPSWTLPMPLAGVAGLDAFGDLSLILDYPGAQIGLGDGVLPEPDRETVFDYAVGGPPSVPITVDGVTFVAILDTGQIRAPLLLTADLARRLGRSEPTPAGEASAGGLTVSLKEIGLRGPARVGRLPLSISSAVFPPPSSGNNLGALALQDLVVDIDRVNRRIRLDRPDARGR
jgi:hypothetical protein